MCSYGNYKIQLFGIYFKKGQLHEVNDISKNEQAEMVMALYGSGMKIADIVHNTELSRSTVNRIIKNHSDKAETITA